MVSPRAADGLPAIAFTATWCLEALVDYELRIADGDVRSGGLDRDLWFALHLAALALAIAIAAHVYRRFTRPARIGLIAAQVVVGGPVYVLACLGYGIGSGIDFL